VWAWRLLLLTCFASGLFSPLDAWATLPACPAGDQSGTYWLQVSSGHADSSVHYSSSGAWVSANTTGFFVARNSPTDNSEVGTGAACSGNCPSGDVQDNMTWNVLSGGTEYPQSYNSDYARPVACTPPPDPCPPLAGQPVPGSPFWEFQPGPLTAAGAAAANAASNKNTCADNFCEASSHSDFCGGDGAGFNCHVAEAYTGQDCNGGDATGGAISGSTPPPAGCGAGMTQGTVNGVATCLASGSGSNPPPPPCDTGSSYQTVGGVSSCMPSPTQITASGSGNNNSGAAGTGPTDGSTGPAGGPAGGTAAAGAGGTGGGTGAGSTQGTGAGAGGTVCQGGMCQSINADGSTNPAVGEPAYCSAHPADPVCANNDGGSADPCTAPLDTCSGDALQCAQLQEAHKDRCDYENDQTALKGDPNFTLGNSINAGQDPLASSFPTAANGTTTDMSTILDSSGFNSGSCFQDKSVTVSGHAILIPFSEVCGPLGYLADVMVAIAGLISAYIVFNGSRKS